MVWKDFDFWLKKALEKLKPWQFETFLVGVRLEKEYPKEKEELKLRLKKEIGKRIERETGKKVDFEHPDVVLILDLERKDVNLQINPLFIYGRYRKLVRGIPQTRWHCKKCRGRGCERCNFTGKMYPESVEELIKNSIVDDFGAKDVILHGHGREDIDVRMLGKGRPFVLEIKEPKKRKLDLRKLEEKINRENRGKVEVEGLKYVDRKTMIKVKNSEGVKEYLAKIEVEEKVGEKEVKEALEKLEGKTINQRTPKRVLHRRADLLRKRKVYEAKLLSFKDSLFKIKIKCDGGLYIKELVSGDEGRTKPSLSELLKKKAEVKELDVVGVELKI